VIQPTNVKVDESSVVQAGFLGQKYGRETGLRSMLNDSFWLRIQPVVAETLAEIDRIATNEKARCRPEPVIRENPLNVTNRLLAPPFFIYLQTNEK
jgi:hypothetical protein